MKHTKSIFLSLFVLVIFNAKAQSIDTLLVQYRNEVLFEKAYVQFDNYQYAPGQTIWYKAYLMNGFQPSLLSKNFYIDWFDDDGNLLHRSITPVIFSFSNGHFDIPVQLKGSTIHAVGYTRWMKNVDSSYFFHQSFSILSNNALKKPKQEYDVSLSLLPESGHIISGKVNQIAFKAINNYGLPESIQGVIKNSKGDTIQSFKSLHDGMGKFPFIPNALETYTAFWKDALGTMHKTVLPDVESIGINMYLESGRGNRLFHIQRTYNLPVELRQLTLVGQMQGYIVFKADIDLNDKESLTSVLPINKFPSGILQLTLFDTHQQPICERLICIKNEDYKLGIDIVMDSINVNRRGKNVFSITIKDSTAANLSIAVADLASSKITKNNIVSQMLLQGELKGKIYDPAYYFSSNADSIIQHLDLVMLTHGWSRYRWDTILKNSSPHLKYLQETNFQTLKGHIDEYANRKNKNQDLINLIIIDKDSSSSVLTLPILEDGSFENPNTLLFDTLKIYYKLTSGTHFSKEKVHIGNDFLNDVSSTVNHESPFSSDTLGFAALQKMISEQHRLDALNQSNTLKAVTVYAKQKIRMKELDSKYTTGPFTAQPLIAFDMSDIQNASHTSSIFDFLTGKVPGLTIGNDLGGLATEGVVNYRGGTPNFYLDERAIATSELPLINMMNIAYIKVFNPPFMGGMNNALATQKSFIYENGKRSSVVTSTGNHASGAAIVIYTKRGDDVGKSYSTIPNGLDFKNYIGYSKHKEFYSPVYTEVENSNKVEDARSTLLWNPWLALDKQHPKNKIVFYNNDISKGYRVVIEGMDGKGKLLYFTKVIQ